MKSPNVTNKKVLFVYPGIAYIGYDCYDRSLSGSDSDPIYAFSLLASIVLSQGFEVSLLDLRQMSSEEDLYLKLSRCDADIVAISVQTPSYDIATRVACLAKGLGKTTIGGGIHATVAPEDFADNPVWDHVITGEAEISFPRLLNDLVSAGNPDKMINGDMLQDLDQLPLPHIFPEWERKYRSTYSIEIARGCPGRCTYCVSGEKKFFKKIRFRSVDHVMKELDYVYDRFKFQHLLFLDVCASNNPKYFYELLTRITEKYRHLSITTQERVDSFNETTAGLLAKFSNCMVWFGFESASQRMLDFINKSVDAEKGRAAAELCRKYNLKIGANILIGIPTELEDDIRMTYDYIKRIRPDMLFCNILSPFPGTKIQTYCQEQGIMPEVEFYDRYELRNVLDRGFLLEMDYDTIRYWHRRFNTLIRVGDAPRWKNVLKRLIYENVSRKLLTRVVEHRLGRFAVERFF